MIKKLFSLVLFLAFCAPVFAIDKVAVVDVQKVVKQSSQVQALKKEQEAKAKEIAQLIKKANDEVKAQTDESKKKAIIQKYEKEIAVKREASAKVFQAKTEAFEKTVNAKITEYAKTNGYDVVLVKGATLYGGTDITDAISKAVK